MTPEDRDATNVALRHTLVGRFLCGVHFYAGQEILLVDALDDEPKPVEREVFIHVGTRWQLFERLPDVLPSSEEELEAHSLSELCSVAGDLQPHRIVDASLGIDAPHLLIRFDDGRTLFLNGHHERYEPWDVVTGDFTIVCCPGDGVALWAPAEFKDA
ncbi:MAG TPA: hypothetical protein VGB53_10665 [Rubricoccaceae bacterium]|jgi:hypothetical protein